MPPTSWWIGCTAIIMLDLWSKGHWFYSHLGHCQVSFFWTDDCLLTSKPSWYITNRQDQLSLPSLWGR